MYPNTPGSESTSNLYSGSDTDDFIFGSGLHCDPPAIVGSLFPQSMEVEHETNTEKKVAETSRGPTESKNGAAGHKIYEPTTIDHKRKRSGDDVGEARIITVPSPGHMSISFSGKDITYRSPSTSETGVEVPSNSGLTTKRTRFDELSSVLPTGHSEGDLRQNGPALVSSLNVQIWRRVFCFVPPVFLGRLLRVNRLFHSLLSPDISHMPVQPLEETGSATFSSAEVIWAASRRRFCPGLPKPLRGLHELQMWRLLRGSDCQLCGERSNLLTSSATSNPWEAGPGSAGVRVIWPFGTRCCGKCLRSHSEKEVTLLFSSTFQSFLLQALPFAFVSQSEHFITSMALRNAIPPADVRLTKHYFKNHIEEIKRQLQVVKDLGPGSAEEWIKGLENEGQERYNDAARWEQWELKGGLKKVNIRPNSKTAPSMAGQTIALVPSAKVLPKSRNGNNKQVITEEDPAASVYPLSTASETTSRALQSSTYIPSTAHMALPPRPQIAISQVRPERNIRDVIEAKAARRAEIERRCLSLDPPLEANVLFHMESFQAALQISTTLTDSAWEILKPRLLAQRESAEYRERERVLQSELLQARSEERKHQEAQLKETKELLDKEWDTIQAPIRERLGVFADEFIKASWAGGSSVTKDNCPTFAADVLLYARRRFYDDVAQGDNARHVARENVRSESPNDSPTSKLNLENMKWLFDNKIKNFTENFQKDLFLCNGCDGNFKFYGFEGVIQHYAAKHTTSLSMGSVVVHWRAEWPDPPPFNPNPNVAKAPYYSVPLPTSTSAQNQFSRPPQPMALYDEYAQMAAPSIQPPLGHSSQYSTSSYQAHYPVQLHNGHYPDVSTIPNGYSQLSNYDGPLVISQPPMQYHTSRPENPVVLGHDYHSFSENSATHLQLNRSNTSFNLYTPAAQQPAYPQPYLPRQQGGSYRSSLPTISPVNPLPTYPTRTASDYQPKNMPGPDLYNIHMNEMAHQASCVWMETSGIKDIPQSVRIFIVIHHTIVRFMQKYAIEPSLAMFIDCLDHNPLMRPVRSLNGLACKTCVTRGNNSGDEYHSHPRRKATDRKLYTLPHLLNHFKTIHVERMQSAMDLRSGPESSRLDWKQDMIELPETPLIANLVNAPGTDSSKFQLIATVFPNIFPVSLPIKGYIEYTEPNFAHGRRHNGAIVRPYDGSSALEIAPTSPSQAEIQAHSDTLTPLRPESFLQTSSRTSTRPSEPPGDDEYDPNRPAYYGKMIDSRQFAPRKVLNEQSSAEVVRMRRTAMPQLGSTHDIANSQDSQPQPPREERARSDDDQAEGMGRHEALHLIAARSSVMGHGTTASFRAATGLGKNRSFNFEDSSRYVSEDGELIEEPTSVLQNHISASDVADVTAAERFLNEIYPGVGQNGDQTEEDPSARGSRSLHSKQNTVGILSHQQLGSVGRAAEVVAVKRTEDNTQYNIRSTPWFTEHIEPRSSDNLPHPHIPNDHRQFFDPLSYSGPRARHQYTAHPYPAGELSTRVDDARTTCHEAHISPGIDEHLISTFRNARKPSQWLDTEIRRRRSRSPVLVACTLEQYRAQSPRQRSPHVSSYHVKPPIPPSDGHLRRIIQYACPIDQNDVARPRMAGYPEEHYGQRIEYIPIQEDHHGYQDKDGYMIAQPVEQMRSTDQILMERTYVQDEVIEADRHLYYAARRQADARPIRTTNPAYFEYRGI